MVSLTSVDFYSRQMERAIEAHTLKRSKTHASLLQSRDDASSGVTMSSNAANMAKLVVAEETHAPRDKNVRVCANGKRSEATPMLTMWMLQEERLLSLADHKRIANVQIVLVTHHSCPHAL